MKIFLKCYYGFKNFGDEMLFFGVIDFLSKKFPLEEVVIEVGESSWMEGRISRNTAYLPGIAIHIVQIHTYSHKKYKNYLKVFGGGDVLNDEETFDITNWLSPLQWFKKCMSHIFTRTGRNYFGIYRRDIFRRNFILLGGIGRPRRICTKLLYKIILPLAQHIIVRDAGSYKTAEEYGAKNLEMYQDFATGIIQSILPFKKEEKSYILVNISSHVYTEENLRKIENFISDKPNHEVVFFPCDYYNDKQLYEDLRARIPRLMLWDRTQHTMEESLVYIAGASSALGSRLHFLLPCKIYGVSYEPIVYKEKVQNIILASG